MFLVPNFRNGILFFKSKTAKSLQVEVTVVVLTITALGQGVCGDIGSSCRCTRAGAGAGGWGRCGGVTVAETNVTAEQLTSADGGEVEFSVVILTAGDELGVSAHAKAFLTADLEDCADGTAVLAGGTLHAHVVLTAVIGVSVTGEGTGGYQLSCGGTQEVLLHGGSLLLALGNVVHPVADAGCPVVGEAGSTGIPGGLTSPAGPEDGAVVRVGEDAIQVRAVCGANRCLEFGPANTVHVMDVIAVFTKVLRISVVEGQTVAANLHGRDATFAGVISVAG